jgi:hypothetical protein
VTAGEEEELAAPSQLRNIFINDLVIFSAFYTFELTPSGAGVTRLEANSFH